MLTEDCPEKEYEHILDQKQVLLPLEGSYVANLDEYMELSNFEGLKRAMAMRPLELIKLVTDSNLRGRGGAGFPVGVKWKTVAESDCATRYVVCNAAEGEPGTYKDRYLIRKNPYQLLEGIMIAAHAVGAKGAVIGTKEKFSGPVERLRAAISEMEQAEIVPPKFITVYEGPDEYLFGEEKALLEAIDGRGALPRIMPPYMLGIYEKPHSPNPTVVNNVESLSNLPHILRNGADWFRNIGSSSAGGTMIFTLSGDIKNPGMYELPMGTPLRELLYDLGGGSSGEHPIKAVFSGVANAVITPDQFDTPMDFDAMKRIGSGLGSGGFIVYDESACMVHAAMLFAQFLAQGSCGQCMPCGLGTGKMAELLQKLESGKGSESDIEDIMHERGKMTNQTRCYLPAQAANLIPSIIERFPEEFHNHCHEPCVSLRHLSLPQINYFDETHSNFFIS